MTKIAKCPGVMAGYVPLSYVSFSGPSGTSISVSGLQQPLVERLQPEARELLCLADTGMYFFQDRHRQLLSAAVKNAVLNEAVDTMDVPDDMWPLSENPNRISDYAQHEPAVVSSKELASGDWMLIRRVITKKTLAQLRHFLRDDLSESDHFRLSQRGTSVLIREDHKLLGHLSVGLFDLANDLRQSGKTQSAKTVEELANSVTGLKQTADEHAQDLFWNWGVGKWMLALGGIAGVGIITFGIATALGHDMYHGYLRPTSVKCFKILSEKIRGKGKDDDDDPKGPPSPGDGRRVGAAQPGTQAPLRRQWSGLERGIAADDTVGDILITLPVSLAGLAAKGSAAGAVWLLRGAGRVTASISKSAGEAVLEIGGAHAVYGLGSRALWLPL